MATGALNINAAEEKKNIYEEYCQSVDTANNEKLLQPVMHIFQVPGQNNRTQLANAFNYWLRVPADKIKAISDIIHFVHHATLVIDDIQDDSVLRRGIPVAHSIYGIPQSLNSANYCLFIALKKVLELNHPEGAAAYSEQLLALFGGQGIEIYWRDNYECPTEQEYMRMSQGKTGGMFKLVIRLMQLFSENKTDFSKFLDVLGYYYQVRDDYCHLRLQQYGEKKIAYEDLTEGKFTFPIIHAIRTRPDNHEIINILRQRTKDMDKKRFCIELMDKFGSFAHTRQVLTELDAELRVEVERLGGNVQLVALLDRLCDWRDAK